MKKVVVKPANRPLTTDEIIEAHRRYISDRPPLPEPTRLFAVGDKVRYGGHQNVHVVEVLDDGLMYLLWYDYIDENSQVKHKFGHTCTSWLDIFALETSDTGFSQKDDLRIVFTNSDIDSLLHKVYSAGVDFDPPYQRDLVWTLDQKISLLDSIFSNVEIGKFTFNRLDYGKAHVHKLYQIIDGKQRLTTMCEFYEGRLPYRGKLYHELSWSDRNHFSHFQVVQAEMRDATEQQILRLFVKLNTTGTPMSPEHLEKVKSMII